MGRASLCGFLLAAALGGGCYKGDFSQCSVLCATDGDCPNGLSCNDGACSSGASCAGALADADIDADLTQPQTLTITRTGGGTGTITSDPAGIDCGATCTAQFEPNSTVTLTATPDATSVVDLSNACTTSPCTVTMDGPKTVEAAFSLHGARRWHDHITGAGNEYVYDSTIDDEGNFITLTFFEGSTSNGYVITKYAGATGTPVWTQTYDFGAGFPIPGGVDVDADGNVYLCGRLQGAGAIVVGGKTLTGDVFGNAFAMRLAAATGEVDWAKSWNNSGQETCEAIAVGGTDVFIAGYASTNPYTFDGITISNAGVGHGYLARMPAATGVVSAVRPFAGALDIVDVAVNGAKVAVVGRVRADTTVGNCTLDVTSTGDEAFIAQFNTADLQCNWDVTEGDTDPNVPAAANAVAALPDGSWVVAGNYRGSVNFGGTTALPTDDAALNAFLARFESDGDLVYQYAYGAAGTGETATAVATTPTGEIIFAGEFASAITLGQFMLTGTSDAFITRLTGAAAPLHEWAIKVGGSVGDAVHAVEVDAAGTVFAVGSFTGMTLIEDQPLSSQQTDSWAASFVR